MQIRNDVKENQFKKNKYFLIFHSQEANFHNLEKFELSVLKHLLFHFSKDEFCSLSFIW